MKVHLFHFNQSEVVYRAEQLKTLGGTVTTQLPDGPQFFKTFKAVPPDVVVIDLSRLPSQGRDIGIYLRTSKATRFIPLIFVDGSPDKIAKTQEQLPDAIYTSWEKIGEALTMALSQPVINPVVPASSLAGYSGTPLPKKLGIKENMIVGLMHAPADFAAQLGQLPPNVTLKNEPEAVALLLWFVRSVKQLETDISHMKKHAGHARIWMIWPKKTSAKASDLTQQVVRDIGLAAGLVDYKVCAIDETWSGLLFTKKK
ncbi:hypothetical protein EH223_01535 [candidate division KSB1 bacterium]|nr:hypothetical protein [candidate division KSB1 bacterium]RQW06881.1 MAG: hypothetical protein EH223_01535 [candidate division KSB1 bacterium]